MELNTGTSTGRGRGRAGPLHPALTHRPEWQASARAPHSPGGTHSGPGACAPKARISLESRKPQGQAWGPSLGRSQARCPLMLCWGRLRSSGRGHRLWLGREVQCSSMSLSPSHLSKRLLQTRGPCRAVKMGTDHSHPGSSRLPRSHRKPQSPHPKTGLMTICDLEPQTIRRGARGPEGCAVSGWGRMGRASPGPGTGSPGTALLWVGGWAAHPVDGLWYLWRCSPFSVFLPSLWAIPPAAWPSCECLGQSSRAPCSQASRPLGRGPDRSPGEGGAGNRLPRCRPSPKPPPVSLLGVVLWGKGILQTSLLGYP